MSSSCSFKSSTETPLPSLRPPISASSTDVPASTYPSTSGPPCLALHLTAAPPSAGGAWPPATAPQEAPPPGRMPCTSADMFHEEADAAAGHEPTAPKRRRSSSSVVPEGHSCHLVFAAHQLELFSATISAADTTQVVSIQRSNFVCAQLRCTNHAAAVLGCFSLGMFDKAAVQMQHLLKGGVWSHHDHVHHLGHDQRS
jgi:hypothetical protein